MRTRALRTWAVLATVLVVLATVASTAATTAATTTLGSASTGSAQEALGLRLAMHPWQARAGGVVTIRAKVYNRGGQDLSNVNVRFSVPDYFTVGRLATSPKLMPARAPVVEQDVRTRTTNIYWLDTPVRSHKARAFRFKARIANCPQLVGKTARVGMMGYLTAPPPNNTVVYSTSIYPKEVRRSMV